MKYLVFILALLAGLQVDAVAQHVEIIKPQKVQHKKKAQHRKVRRVRPARAYRPVRSERRETMASPYRGENVRANDGVRKNEQRNLNYNTGQPLPPSTGGR